MSGKWKYVKLGQVCTVERGGSPRPIDKYITTSDEGVNWIKIGDTTDSMYITSTEQKIIPEGMKKSRYVRPGDFLLSNSMSFGRPYILKFDGCIHDGWLVLRDNENLFDKRFLYYFLSAPVTYRKFKQLAVGGVVNNLNSDMVRNVEVPIPSIEEQEQIATILDKVTELIALRKQQLSKLDELVKARFVELFGNILCDSDLPSVQLKELADIGSSKRIYANEYVESGVPFYRSKEIRELGTGLKPAVELFIKQERYDEIKDKYGVPKKGDILIAAIGATIGYSWIVDTDKPFYYKDGNLIILSTKNNVNPIFLNHTMGILIEDFKSKGVAGSAQLALTIEKLEKMMVINPSIDLQNQFAAFVEQTDKSKLAVQKSLEELETLKKSLMQQYFG